MSPKREIDRRMFIVRFSRTVISAKMPALLRSSVTNPMPSRIACSGPFIWSCRPPRVTVPPSGRMRP